jgi:hypothetical protein
MPALWDTETVTIASGDTYSSVLDFRAWSLLMVKVTPAGTLQGARLCLQARENSADAWAPVDPAYAAYTLTGKTGTWLPIQNNDQIGSIYPPFMRFYVDNGSGTPAAQTAAVSIACIMKNVS